VIATAQATFVRCRRAPPAPLAKLFTRLDRIRALAFDRTLPPPEALGRIRDGCRATTALAKFQK
jgi:hypothetical protein